MPDIAPLVIAVLSLLATVTLGVALYGRRDLASPRCRRCKADVREKAMDGSFTCACGAELLKRRAVTFPYRVRRRWAVVGLAFALAAFGLGVVETRVLSIGLGWRAVYPNWLFNLTWPHDADPRLDDRLLLRRVDALASRDEARALLDAVLRRTDSVQLLLDFGSRSTLARLVAMAAPSGDLAARTAHALAARVSPEVFSNSIELSFGALGSGIDEAAVIVVRVDEVLVDGVAMPFERGGDAFAGGDGAWRRWSELQSMASFRAPRPISIDDSPRSARLQAMGEIVYLSLPASGEWWRTDPLLLSESDPDRWGIDLVRAPFVARGVTTSPSISILSNPVAVEQVGPFFDRALGRPLPPRIAASQPIACAVVGIAVGLAALLGIAVVRFATVSPWMLDVAACPQCRSCLRGPGTGLPERCPECGAEADPATVRYGLRVVIRPLAALGGALVALAVAALTTLFGVETAERVRASVRDVGSDAEYVARWLAYQSLAGRGDFAGYDRGPPRPAIRFLTDALSDESALATAERVFALTIANGWRDAEAERATEGRPPSMTERLGWYEAIGAVPGGDANDDVGLVAAGTSMSDAWGLPGVAAPRAVRVGERIVPRVRLPFEHAIGALRVRERRPDRVSRGWARLPDSPLGVATAVGSVSYELEWAPKFGDDAPGSIGGALDRTIRGTVRVLPNDGSVTVVTDPALNPLDGGATVTLEIREAGERDLVTITADDAAVGVALAGFWRLGDATGGTPPRVLSRQPRGPWAGLVSVAAWTGDATAGAYDGRPDEVVATFVPDPNAGPIKLDASGVVTILWGSETTVRFRRVPQREFDMVARYELVP